MMVPYLKHIASGDFEAARQLTGDPGRWIADGFKCTELASVLGDVADTGDRLGLPFGVGPTGEIMTRGVGEGDRAGGRPIRFERPDRSEVRLGPVFGILRNVAGIVAATAGDGSGGDDGAGNTVRNAPPPGRALDILPVPEV
jgi:hypothetical protein